VVLSPTSTWTPSWCRRAWRDSKRKNWRKIRALLDLLRLAVRPSREEEFYLLAVKSSKHSLSVSWTRSMLLPRLIASQKKNKNYLSLPSLTSWQKRLVLRTWKLSWIVNWSNIRRKSRLSKVCNGYCPWSRKTPSSTSSKKSTWTFPASGSITSDAVSCSLKKKALKTLTK